MTLDRLRELYLSKPFHPFIVRLADGRDVTVKSPEFMSFSPSGRTIVVHEPDDSMRIIDLLLVTELHVQPNGKSGKQAPPRRK
jgi:hypothetical protein